jgi:hypothetical protein
MQFYAVRDTAPVMIINIDGSLEMWTNSALRAVVHRMSKPVRRLAAIEDVKNAVLPARRLHSLGNQPDEYPCCLYQKSRNIGSATPSALLKSQRYSSN